MVAMTTFDVSQYARLWRGVWWTQHLAMLLALVVGGLLLGALVTYLAGGLEAVANAEIERVWGRTGLNDAKREEELMNTAVFYWMARSVLQSALPTVISIVAASLVLIGTYALGCRTFRLRLLTVNLLALAVVTVITGTALVLLARANVLAPDYDPPGGRVQVSADQALAAICFLVLVPSLVLLIVEGVLAYRLWRHRFPGVATPIHQMTRSFGSNLAIPQFWTPSPPGFAIHLGVLGMLAGLVWWFSEWVGGTLVMGPINLLLLLLWLAVQPMSILYRALTGQTVVLPEDFRWVPSMIQESARLVVLAVVLIAARAIWRLGTRFNLRRRDAIILKDKPPVLLLRSFADDVAGITPSALIPRLLWRRKRLEETIGKELAQAGPFVAIGKPGETLPQIGAQRLYVADTDWQEVVKSYIAYADPIILIAGKTTWVQWELAAIVATARAAHLLIVFPRTSEAERAARWQNLKPALANTHWSAAADAVDIAGALAVVVRSEGFLVIRSRAAHESDYEAALRVATFLMGQGDPSFRSRL
jgi:hypothetical protein